MTINEVEQKIVKLKKEISEGVIFFFLGLIVLRVFVPIATEYSFYEMNRWQTLFCLIAFLISTFAFAVVYYGLISFFWACSKFWSLKRTKNRIFLATQEEIEKEYREIFQ